MSLILIHSAQLAEHQPPPGHPERPERAEVMDVIVGEWRDGGGEVVAPRAATAEQLRRVHDGDYLRRIAETAGSSVQLDPDTFTSPETYEIAHLAAGAAVDAVERVLSGPHVRALALVRPPGHHAERSKAMGFCFYNNVAVAAAHARALGVPRVAVVDYDVHHGNGTQHMFDEDPSVLYISTHQHPFYPGTGDAKEIGAGDGRGFTVNVPLEVGSQNEDFRVAFAEVILPVLREFTPGLVLISAGFDAHERDPLAGMRLTTPAFAAMTHDLRAVADECCGGRLVAVTEGGYDLRALADSLRAVVSVMGPDQRPVVRWPNSEGVVPNRGHAGVTKTKAALSGYWKLQTP
ncbi:MAG: histone deacetylase [Acidimicrobiia bacterium]|nr:histone deacetylase [Acidimicrobiia bacterium]